MGVMQGRVPRPAECDSYDFLLSSALLRRRLVLTFLVLFSCCCLRIKPEPGLRFRLANSGEAFKPPGPQGQDSISFAWAMLDNGRQGKFARATSIWVGGHGRCA